MKRILLVFAFTAAVIATQAQNIQLHYDLGEGRNYFTSTVEMFKPDKWGSTFFFIDMDYSSDARNVDNGVSLAYWEIARAFKWNENQKFQPRVEYNGGVFKLDGEDTPFVPIENCWLAGVERTWASADFSKILTLQGNYKYIKNKEDASFQLTAVWTVFKCCKANLLLLVLQISGKKKCFGEQITVSCLNLNCGIILILIFLQVLKLN